VRGTFTKVVEEHGIILSYTWVKLLLQGAGLVKPLSRRGAHRKRRPRRPMRGMLLHIDASRHAWFQEERWYDLLSILDDATSEIYYAQLVEEEGTCTATAALRRGDRNPLCVVQRSGQPLFRDAQTGGESGCQPVDTTEARPGGDRHPYDSGVFAAGPGAHGTQLSHLAGTVTAGITAAGIRIPPAANVFLRERYIAEFNRRFAVPANQRGTVFIRCRLKDLRLGLLGAVGADRE
jgi:hypothetical protein